MKTKRIITRMKKAVSMMICFFVFMSCVYGYAEEQNIIEDVVVYYSSYGEEADETIDGLLKELSEDTASKWQTILDYWKYANSGIEINYDVLPDGLPETDNLCMVALGFQLNEDGSMKEELIERLKVVLASAEKYPNAYIVCTGGGTAKNDGSATEAGRMAAWLAENGIDSERIIVEDHSLTTAQNAIYTCNILSGQYPQIEQLAIISSDYHIATGALLFEAEAVLQDDDLAVVSNAACKAPSGTLSTMFQAGALIELSGDAETAFDIYYETYDIHELPQREEKQTAIMADALEATTGYSMSGWDKDQPAEWFIPDCTEMTDEITTIFNRALEGSTDVDFEPIAFLGESEGVYCVFCRAAVSDPNVKPYYSLVYVTEDGIQNVWDIWMEKHAQ